MQCQTIIDDNNERAIVKLQIISKDIVVSQQIFFPAGWIRPKKKQVLEFIKNIKDNTHGSLSCDLMNSSHTISYSEGVIRFYNSDNTCCDSNIAISYNDHKTELDKFFESMLQMATKYNK